MFGDTGAIVQDGSSSDAPGIQLKESRMTCVITANVGPHLPGGDAIDLAMEVFLPVSLADGPVLFFCIPGGGMCRRYFDLDGGAGLPFSFARAMTEAGHVVVAIDPVGVGDSTKPDDGFALNSELVAGLDHKAFTAMRSRVINGIALADLPTVGVGHSAGALLAVLQQSAYRDFDAMLLFCFGSGGLPQHFPEDYIVAAARSDFDRAAIIEMARQRFGGDGYMRTRERPIETPAARALKSAASVTVAAVGTHAMTPGNVRAELATLACPVFLSLGGRDMTGPPHLLSRDFEACPDLTVHVIADAGHHLFVIPTAPELYRRVVNWICGVVPVAGREMKLR